MNFFYLISYSVYNQKVVMEPFQEYLEYEKGCIGMYILMASDENPNEATNILKDVILKAIKNDFWEYLGAYLLYLINYSEFSNYALEAIYSNVLFDIIEYYANNYDIEYVNRGLSFIDHKLMYEYMEHIDILISEFSDIESAKIYIQAGFPIDYYFIAKSIFESYEYRGFDHHLITAEWFINNYHYAFSKEQLKEVKYTLNLYLRKRYFIFKVLNKWKEFCYHKKLDVFARISNNHLVIARCLCVSESARTIFNISIKKIENIFL